VVTQYGNVFVLFCRQFGLNVRPDDDNVRVPVLAWNTCAFTLMSFGQYMMMMMMMIMMMMMTMMATTTWMIRTTMMLVWFHK
jgi:hypothetical protein